MSFEGLGKKLGALASGTAKKAGIQVQIAKMGLDKVGLEKEIEGVYIAMGRFCYKSNKEGAELAHELLKYCSDIDDIKKNIIQINEDISQIKSVNDDFYDEPTNIEATFDEPIIEEKFEEDETK